jgi:hypothetical protein
VLGALAGGYEDAGGGFARRDVGGVPEAGRVDRVVAGGERHAREAAVRLLLNERDGAGGADHQLGAVRVALPARPAFGKVILRDEPAFDAVGRGADAIGLVPLHAGERRLHRRGAAAAEMDVLGGEVGHGAPAFRFSEAQPRL